MLSASNHNPVVDEFKNKSFFSTSPPSPLGSTCRKSTLPLMVLKEKYIIDWNPINSILLPAFPPLLPTNCFAPSFTSMDQYYCNKGGVKHYWGWKAAIWCKLVQKTQVNTSHFNSRQSSINQLQNQKFHGKLTIQSWWWWLGRYWKREVDPPNLYQLFCVPFGQLFEKTPGFSWFESFLRCL